MTHGESKRMKLWVALLVVIGGGVPPALHWAAFERVPWTTPARAREMLQASGETIALVDVRAAEEFEARHIDGAVSWPFEHIMASDTASAVPAELRGRTLLMVCDSGMMSALSARHILDAGLGRPINTRGGIQAWIASAESPAGGCLMRFLTASSRVEPLPARDSPFAEQWGAVMSAFMIKPTYMLLSLVLVALLWRRRSPDLVALRWGLAFFFLGELLCAVNYFVFDEGSYLSEYLHSYGMVLTFGFITYAFCEGLDRRLVHFSHPTKRCAALGLCRACFKHVDVPCGLQRVFMFVIAAFVLVALMPFAAQPDPMAYNTWIYDTYYTYFHSVPHQVFEIRVCPIAAILLLTASLLVLAFCKRDPMPAAKVLFAAGMGPLCFSFLRIFLFAAYRDNLFWFVFWEEATELIFVASVAAVLWTFRHALFELESST